MQRFWYKEGKEKMDIGCLPLAVSAHDPERPVAVDIRKGPLKEVMSEHRMKYDQGLIQMKGM